MIRFNILSHSFWILPLLYLLIQTQVRYNDSRSSADPTRAMNEHVLEVLGIHQIVQVLSCDEKTRLQRVLSLV